MKTLRLTIENKKENPILVFIEPEAMDYWLQSKETCELVAEKKGEEAHFEIQYTNEGITVFPSRDCGFISVFQKGIQLECGYQRPSNC
jgi:hypothetical protein